MDPQYQRKLNRAMQDVLESVSADKNSAPQHFSDANEAQQLLMISINKLSVEIREGNMTGQRKQATDAAAALVRFLVELM